jgi:plasmid stabilization system protein ParE
VRFSRTAADQLRTERRWWVENRLSTDVFAEELDEAVRIIAFLPGAGTPYEEEPFPGLRRIYLRRISCHLYFTFDESEVIVHAIWGSRRRRGPFPREEI